MGSLHKARLARRLTALHDATCRTVRRRATARANAAAVAAIRAAVAAAKIDPFGISCLRAFGDAEARLRELGDSPDVQAADAAFAITEPALFGGNEILLAEAAQLAPRFRGQPPPERGASLLDWYAWSLAVDGAGSAGSSPHPSLSRSGGEGCAGLARPRRAPPEAGERVEPSASIAAKGGIAPH